MVAVVAALVVVGGGGYGLYFLLSGGSQPAPRPTAESRIADALFQPDPNAQSDGTKQSIRDMAAAGNTVVAVGGEVGGAFPRPRFIVSGDQGRTWRIGQIKTEDGREPRGSSVNSVVGSNGAWVALGGDGDFRVAWTSADGATWTQVGGRISAFRAADEIQQIARTSQGFVAVGHSGGTGKNSVPVVWLSPDGRSWQRLDKGRLKLPTAAGSVTRLRYVAVANNVVIISGDVVTSKSVVAGVWRSTNNGRTWKTVPPPNDDGAFGPTHLASTATGFVALREGKAGADRFGRTFVSRDGVSWQPAGRITTSSGEATEFSRLSGGEDGVALLVKVQGDRTLLYRSPDGINWQRAADLGNDPKRNTNGLAVTSAATIIGGTRLSQDQDFFLEVVDGSGQPTEINMDKIPEAVNAERSVDDIATAAGRTVAVGSSNGTAAVWTSSDGTNWTRGDAGTAGGVDGRSRFIKVTHGSAGWLAIGWSNNKPLVAGSADGNTWQRVDDKVFVPGRGLTLTLNAVAAGPKGYVIGGTETADGKSSAVVFASADMRSWQRAQRNGLGFTHGSSRQLLSLAATPTGYVAAGIAADTSLKQDDQSMPGIWTSSDGVRWALRRPALPDGVTTGYVTQLAAQGNSVTALGVGNFSGGRRVFGLTSADAGSTWRVASVSMPTTESGSSTDVTSLITTTNGFVAAGTSGRPRGGDVVLWTSRDGGSWQLSTPHGVGLSGPGVQQIQGMAQRGNTLVGVGLTADYRAEHVTLWKRPL